MIVINNRSATAELIFHQGLLLASRRNSKRNEEALQRGVPGEEQPSASLPLPASPPPRKP